MAEVISINKKENEKAKEKKPKIAELFYAVTNAMNFEEVSFLPVFPVAYYVVEAAGTRKILKKTGDREVIFVDLDEVATTMVRYTQDAIGTDAYKWPISVCLDCAKFWLFYTAPIQMPKAVGFQETVGLVFNRLPWRRVLTDLSTPTFDELFSRIDNGEPLKKWIGSLFFKESDRQTYCWLYGQGRNGKGAISRFLRRVFGVAYGSETVPQKEERFWTAGLVDKRLIAFNDCNNYGFPSTGLFKSLTGGDHIRCEEKFGKVFTAELSAKFMFLSNDRPALSSSEADTRRIILCEFGRIKDETSPTYEEQLWSEGNAFILKCLHSYIATNADHSPISSSTETIDDWVGVVEDQFDTLIEQMFHVEQTAKTPRIAMYNWLKNNFPKRASQFEFTKFIERKYGVKRIGMKEDGTTKYYYVGMRFRNPFNQEREV